MLQSLCLRCDLHSVDSAPGSALVLNRNAMPDYDGFLEEPSPRKRKYRVYSQSCSDHEVDWPRHWTILLSVVPFDSELLGKI